MICLVHWSKSVLVSWSKELFNIPRKNATEVIINKISPSEAVFIRTKQHKKFEDNKKWSKYKGGMNDNEWWCPYWIIKPFSFNDM